MTLSASNYAVNVSTNQRTYNCRLETAGGVSWLVLTEMHVTHDGYQRAGEVRVEVEELASLARSFEEAASFLAHYAVVADRRVEEEQSPAAIRSRLLQHGLLDLGADGDAVPFADGPNRPV